MLKISLECHMLIFVKATYGCFYIADLYEAAIYLSVEEVTLEGTPF